MHVGHQGNTYRLMEHPAAQYMYIHVHVHVNTQLIFITILIVVGARDKRSGYYKYGEEHCCCFSIRRCMLPWHMIFMCLVWST